MPEQYSKQNLKSHSFRGKDLTGKDFSCARLEGASFRGAVLRGAKFQGARTGCRWWAGGLRWALLLVLAGLSGFFTAIRSLLISFLGKLCACRRYRCNPPGP